MTKVESGNCRFRVSNSAEAKPAIAMELFHDSVPLLSGVGVTFDLLSGATPSKAKELVDLMNEWILGISLTGPG